MRLHFVAGMGCREAMALFADGVGTSATDLTAAADESFCYDLLAGFGVR